MSYTQFGYTYQTSPQLLMTGQSSCCDSNQNGMATDHAAPSPTVCSLPTAYDSRLLSTYPRLATGLTVNGLYGSTYADQAGYVAALGSHPTSFYSTLSPPYDLKDGRTWPTLPQAAAACYSYDPTGLAGYGSYGESKYDAMDSAARRKNATRETTNTLKAWLYEHRKNPYPTKGEKIMLAIITKMTLTQVSTWFANARRRLKKENKMTWEPKNKTGDMADSDDKSDGIQSDEEQNQEKEESKHAVQSDSDIAEDEKPEDSVNVKLTESLPSREDSGSMPRLVPMATANCQMRLENYGDTPPITKLSSENDKPKIWSLAQTAISDTGPPNRKMAFDIPPVNSDLSYTDRTPSVSPSSTSGYWTPSSLRSVDQTSDVGAIQSSPLEDNSRLPSVPNVNPANMDYNSRFQFSALKVGQEILEDVDGEDGNIRTHCHKYAMTSDVKSPPKSLLRFHSNYYLDSHLATGANRNSALGWYFSSQREKDLMKDTKPYVAPNQVQITTSDTTAFKPVTRSEQPIL